MENDEICWVTVEDKCVLDFKSSYTDISFCCLTLVLIFAVDKLSALVVSYCISVPQIIELDTMAIYKLNKRGLSVVSFLFQLGQMLPFV